MCVCLEVWYFLKEFPPTVRAEPPWAPQLSNPQTDPVLLPEREREPWQQFAAVQDMKEYRGALIKMVTNRGGGCCRGRNMRCCQAKAVSPVLLQALGGDPAV